jgi:hypothetical protein
MGAGGAISAATGKEAGGDEKASRKRVRIEAIRETQADSDDLIIQVVGRVCCAYVCCGRLVKG